MTLNFEAFRSGKSSYADAVRDVTHTDLYQATTDLFDTIESIITDVTDMGTTFVPHDPDLKDPNEEAYTLGHVIVHLTATLEESSSIGSVLARGIIFEGRLRESRRMCKAFLDSWPDAPHLDVTIVRIPSFGPMNAVGMHALGILHGGGHIEQLREIMRQSKTLV